MTNVVMIARDRPRLTAQALKSLLSNTPMEAWSLVLVDDGSFAPITSKWLKPLCDNLGYCFPPENWQILRLERPTEIVGLVRNLGAYLSERYFPPPRKIGESEWIVFADNDTYFCPGWLETMTAALEADPNCAILGGQRHPYHGINCRHVLNSGVIEETDAVAGYAMMMPWDVWQGCGPFDAHAKGLGQSEDWALCQKARQQGMYVGYHNPPTILHTGMTDTNGKPIAGAEQFPRVEGVLYA